MAVLATDRADFYAFNPANFLLRYCNANGLPTAGYYVEEKQDGANGLCYFYLHPNADGQSNASDTDPATPQVVNFTPGDPGIAAEVSVSS